MTTIYAKDKQILRETAARQADLAFAPDNQTLERLWIKHNACRGNRPVIHVDWRAAAEAIITPMLRCENSEARKIEYALYMNFIGREIFLDDSVVPPYMPIKANTWFAPFGRDVQPAASLDDALPRLTDVLDKPAKATYGADMQKTQARMEMYSSLLGDILPARLTGECLCVSPLGCIADITGAQGIPALIKAYPKLFHEVMDRLTSDCLEYFRFRETRGLILPTTRGENVCDGTFAFTSELPGPDASSRRPLTPRDVWGFLSTPEAYGIAPDMYREFIFPYYRRIAEAYGMLSYGGDEPVDAVWDEGVCDLPNLRKVSIAPQCDEYDMADRLRGTRIIYYRKLPPEALSDEDALRLSIRQTMTIARGCAIEFKPRCTPDMQGDFIRAQAYVDIIRACCEG